MGRVQGLGQRGGSWDAWFFLEGKVRPAAAQSVPAAEVGTTSWYPVSWCRSDVSWVALSVVSLALRGHFSRGQKEESCNCASESFIKAFIVPNDAYTNIMYNTSVVHQKGCDS